MTQASLPARSNASGHRAPAACTIIARNYLSHARILAASYVRHEPGTRFYILVVDTLPADAQVDADVQVITPDELGLSYFFEMCFKYDVTELCTAVKPTLLSLLLNRYNEEAVAYFDPDILVMRPLDELKAALTSANIVLIPHILTPIPLDGRRPSEQDILIAGAYNLGFIALKKSAQAAAFLRWWEERLRDGCRVSPVNGLMVDQRWVDLVPALFPPTSILRDETYNVAYWNLSSRTLERNDERFYVNGRPLAFFHFSGFDPANRRHLSKHQNRIDVRTGTPLADVLDLYADLHMSSGFPVSSKWSYGYARFDNSMPVHPLLRQLYLALEERSRASFGNPFQVNVAKSFLNWAITPQPGQAGLSPFLESIVRTRYDVAAAFPDARGRHRRTFIHWARTQGAREMGYDPELVRDQSRQASAVDIRPDSAATASQSGSTVSSVSLQSERYSALPNSNTGTLSLTVEAANTKGRGVNVCGYLRNESGLGSAVRRYIRALRTLNVPVALKDLSALSLNRSDDDTLAHVDADAPYDINVFCVNADEHFRILSHLGEQFFRDHYNIAIWAWELPSFPEKWYDRFAYYDELWVGTSFIANTLQPVAPIPVVRIPPVLTAQSQGSRDRGRQRLGIPPGEFMYLFIFDFRSYFKRKNPLALINAFKRAFSPSDPVRLVVKCVNQESSPDEFSAMSDLAQEYSISIVGGYWSSSEMRDLMAACDAYVSLHRSEGTGLTITDAMALGKPAIATGWSGNMDFMNVANSFPVRYELVELEENVGPYRAGEIWADPSVEHAAELLRFVFEHPEEARARGAAAKREIERDFGEEKIAALVRHRLSAIEARRRHPAPQSDSEVDQFTAKNLQYQQLIHRIRDVVRTALPPDATIIVVSKGDDELLKLDGRCAWHFPQTEDGIYAGYYPADSGAAIAHLEALRSKGAEFLLIPSTALWWLRHYEEFGRRLDTRYRAVVRQEDTCLIFALRGRGPQLARRLRTIFGNVLPSANRRIEEAARTVEHLSQHVRTLEGRLAELENVANSGQARLERLWRSMESPLDDLAKTVEAQRARIDELATSTEGRIGHLLDSIRAQAGRADRLAQDLASTARRFAARPYMAKDIFGAGGDLDKPMGYGLDAASLDGFDASPLDFESLFRGSQDFIADRQRVYLPFFKGLRRVVDLGCGRGEFLRLLGTQGINAVGVELHPALVQRVKAEGLNAVEGDALDYLNGLPAASLDGIFSAQFIEHLDPARLVDLLALSKSRLRAGGILIAETVNPESFEALKAFHVDLTHQRPIYPQVLLYMCRMVGFPSARIFYPLAGGFTQRDYSTAGEYAVVAVA